MLFRKSGAVRLRFLENPPQPHHVFFKILRNTIMDFGKSADPNPGIFREKTHNPTSFRRNTVVIICGQGILGEGTMPIFSDNCQHLYCAF